MNKQLKRNQTRSWKNLPTFVPQLIPQITASFYLLPRFQTKQASTQHHFDNTPSVLKARLSQVLGRLLRTTAPLTPSWANWCHPPDTPVLAYIKPSQDDPHVSQHLLKINVYTMDPLHVATAALSLIEFATESKYQT
jgi:hypothetical protein